VSIPLTVTDVKQYMYCPRIIYFTYVMPVGQQPTHNMLIGKSKHLIIENLEKRRTLKKYHLEQAQKRFKVRCYSDSLMLSGLLDMLLENGTELYPVEFKNTSKPPQIHHKLQIAAYAKILEEERGCEINRGFLYTIANGKVYSIALTSELKNRVSVICERVRSIISTKSMPPPTRHRNKCFDCEWRRYCGDIY